jgi:hypothetical protein
MPSRDEIIFQGVLALVILAIVALFVGEGLGFWNVIPQRTDALFDRG